MKGPRWWIKGAAACCVLSIVAMWAFGSAPPQLPSGTIESVEITLDKWADRQKAANTSSKDSTKVEALAAVLRQGQPTGDHKCGDTGSITVRLKDGSTVRLGILAGHDAKYYEYRAYRGKGYDIFRVNREAFQKAMADLGISGLDPGVSEQGKLLVLAPGR